MNRKNKGIKFKITFFVLAISLLLFISFIHYSFPWAFFPLFKKYGSDISYSGFATFDAREFDEGEEMYFKVEAYKDQIIDRDVPYNYRNDIDGTSTGSLFYAKVTSTSSYTENHHHYTRQYFKIKKFGYNFTSITWSLL